MNRGTLTVLAALSLTALVAGGCANKEQIKSEEPIVKSESAPKAPATPPAAQKPVETARVAPQPVAEAPQKPAESQAATTAAAAALGTVYFDFDKADLSQSARDTLNKNAEYLKSKPELKAKIEGHCDERGSAEYNLALGERRAKSSMQYLLTLGIKPERLSIISFGKEKPAVDGHDEAAWAKNRRAEFVIVK